MIVLLLLNLAFEVDYYIWKKQNDNIAVVHEKEKEELIAKHAKRENELLAKDKKNMNAVSTLKSTQHAMMAFIKDDPNIIIRNNIKPTDVSFDVLTVLVDQLDKKPKLNKHYRDSFKLSTKVCDVFKLDDVKKTIEESEKITNQ